jgi:cysteine synthase A
VVYAALHASVLETIGSTPLVALDRIGATGGARVAAKLEYYGPGASVKDRAALWAINAAERDGSLRPGATVVELTSGNMGVGLAVVCAVRGYRLIAVMSEGNSPERRHMLEALGAEVELVPQQPESQPGQVSREDLALVEDRTKELTRSLGAFRPDQFHNQACVRAHEETTGEEIWEQSQGSVTAFVAAVGTGGTFLGVSRTLKRHSATVRCFAVEPATARVLAGEAIMNTSHKLQGTGYAAIPPLWDSRLCDGSLPVSDDEAREVARMLSAREGIFGGYSGGGNVAAALRLAKTLSTRDLVVTIIPDIGLKYLSTDLY